MMMSRIVIDDGLRCCTRKMEVKVMSGIIKVMHGELEYEVEWRMKQ